MEAAASPGSLANRRKKNLTKFRKRKDDQRQTLQSVVPADANKPVESEVSAPHPTKVVAVEQPPAKVAADVESKEQPEGKASKPVAEEATEKDGKQQQQHQPRSRGGKAAMKKFADKKRAAKKQQGKASQPEPTSIELSGAVKVEKISQRAVTESKPQAPSPPPVSPPKVAEGDAIAKAAPSTPKQQPPASPMPPHSQKRRTDIIRKLAKKNHRGADSPRRGGGARQTPPLSAESVTKEAQNIMESAPPLPDDAMESAAQDIAPSTDTISQDAVVVATAAEVAIDETKPQENEDVVQNENISNFEDVAPSVITPSEESHSEQAIITAETTASPIESQENEAIDVAGCPPVESSADECNALEQTEDWKVEDTVEAFIKAEDVGETPTNDDASLCAAEVDVEEQTAVEAAPIAEPESRTEHVEANANMLMDDLVVPDPMICGSTVNANDESQTECAETSSDSMELEMAVEKQPESASLDDESQPEQAEALDVHKADTSGGVTEPVVTSTPNLESEAEMAIDGPIVATNQSEQAEASDAKEAMAIEDTVVASTPSIDSQPEQAETSDVKEEKMVIDEPDGTTSPTVESQPEQAETSDAKVVEMAINEPVVISAPSIDSQSEQAKDSMVDDESDVTSAPNIDSQPLQAEPSPDSSEEGKKVDSSTEASTDVDFDEPEKAEEAETEAPAVKLETVASGEGDKAGETTDAGDVTDLCETSTSFDLRSIHDFPPEPVKTADAALPSKDPSWDTAKVVFSEFEQRESSKNKATKSESLNMFDTTDANAWTATDGITFSRNFQEGHTNNFFGMDITEEKKESDSVDVYPFGDTTAAGHLVVEQVGSEESNASPRRRLSRLQVNNSSPDFGFDVSNLNMTGADERDHAARTTAEEEVNENTSKAELEKPERDDAGLLVNDMNDDGDQELWRNDSLLSKEERVEQYTSPKADGENSSVGSSTVEDDESIEELPEVGYVSHSGEDEDDIIEEAQRTESELDNMPTEIVENVPAFVIPTDSANNGGQDGPDVVAQESPLGNTVSILPFKSCEVEGFSNAVFDTPETADPMQSFSASTSGDNETSVLVLGANNAEGGVEEATKDTEHIGYISNSSSSGSSDDHEAVKRIKLVIITDDVEQEAEADSALQEEPENASGPIENSKSTEQEVLACDVNEEKEAPVDKALSRQGELEESASLVGVSLVPSWGTNSSRLNASLPSGPPKPSAGIGIPPRGSGSPSMLPPPPPPPLSKKKKKKKRKGSSKTTVPLLAPPPPEKLKKWEESKNKAGVQFAGGMNSKSGEEDKAAIASAPRRRPDVAPIECGTSEIVEVESWEESPESPGRLNIACGAFSEQGPWASIPKEACQPVIGPGQAACGSALAMAGLTGSPPIKSDDPISQFASNLSPVDAARSIALGNAMRRANEGLAHFKFNSNSSSDPNHHPACDTVETKSLLEDSMVIPENASSSVNDNETETQPSRETETVENPPELTQKQMPDEETYESFPDSPNAFLQKLTSPSLSMSSPTNDNAHSSLSSSSSPLIRDSKMAEKVALASFAAARTFEEQYAASHDNSDSIGDSLAMTQSSDETSQDDGPHTQQLPSLFCAPEISENFGHMAAGEDGSFFGAKFEQELTGIIEENSELLKDLVNGSTPSRDFNEGDSPSNTQDLLKGGAFSPWKNPVYAKNGELKYKTSGSPSAVGVLSLSSASCSSDATETSVTLTLSTQETSSPPGELLKIHQWLTYEVLKLPSKENIHGSSDDVVRQHLIYLLEDNDNLNKLCSYVADKINLKIEFDNEARAERNAQLSPRKQMRPFQVGRISGKKSSSVVAANFVSFIHRLSKASSTPSPFGEDNPFLLDLISKSIYEGDQEGKLSMSKSGDDTTMQSIVFRLCPAEVIAKFTAQVCGFLSSDGTTEEKADQKSLLSGFDMIEATRAAHPSPTKKPRGAFFGASAQPTATVVVDGHPSPFETAIKQNPKLLITILDFLGDPACVCRMKMVNRGCHTFIAQNEQILIRDAVRLGGMSMNLRPSFWLWVTLEKCGVPSPVEEELDDHDELARLEEAGRTGKWHSVIQRDVTRSFGNMPPHKTGAKLRTDSIVRALVTWGTNRIMKRGVRGGGNPPPAACQSSQDFDSSESDASQAPTETVSDWGGVSPVASFTGSYNGGLDCDDNGTKGRRTKRRPSRDSSTVDAELLVLAGNALTDEMKANLQNKLGYILHTLAATHETVGYCQGMDYVVAHLLRILQDTIRWRAAHGTLPASILSAPTKEDLQSNSDSDYLSHNFEGVDKTLVVEETVFKVMDSLFTTYNLQHMYWPELRCLKTCCRVFERLIQLKLPVLADHFEHHELNVGLFALGWFQTLFLYLPSMPSATVCHMWDIWLVERSFKIFFRVGTAILFLSQPILLNHELEGMMTYLNTFPDATLLNPDILIACALQIKVTNKMLMEIEAEVGGAN